MIFLPPSPFLNRMEIFLINSQIPDRHIKFWGIVFESILVFSSSCKSIGDVPRSSRNTCSVCVPLNIIIVVCKVGTCGRITTEDLLTGIIFHGSVLLLLQISSTLLFNSPEASNGLLYPTIFGLGGDGNFRRGISLINK